MRKLENLKNLNAVIEELNADKVYDFEGEKETIESPYHFVTRINEEENCIEVFDENEEYNIDYVENMNCLNYDCSLEFGYKYEPQTEDEIHTKLEEAVKKDFGKDYYLEWYDSVVMQIRH